MAKTLYIVPTPIGNLQDMTFRAVDVLKKVKLIAAEDTRVTRKLLQHFEIHTELTSVHEHNEEMKLDSIFEALRSGDVALVSDAGTPGISDPGFVLVREAIKRDIQIIPLPGATAFVPALVASGLPSDSFLFLGFTPKKSGPRQSFFQEVASSKQTLIVYESPYRLSEMLEDAYQVLGERSISVSREISKKFESFYRMQLSEAIDFFKQDRLPGEMVICIEGAQKGTEDWDENKVLEALKNEMANGNGLSTAAKSVAKSSGWKKKQVYQLGLKL